MVTTNKTIKTKLGSVICKKYCLGFFKKIYSKYEFDDFGFNLNYHQYYSTMKKSLLYLLITIIISSCSSSEITNNKMASNQGKAKCPLHFGSDQTSGLTTTNQGNTNRDWWPNQLDLSILIDLDS